MAFDLASVITDIKSQLTPAEQAKTKEINTALGLCLEDLATRMRTVAMVATDEVSVAAGSRTVTLTGDTDQNRFGDLRFIYYVKFGTGDDQKVLIPIGTSYFIEEYDNPSEDAGVPSHYTVLLTDEGKPIIKFNCPTSAADTLTLYYFKDATPQNMARFRSKIAIVTGTLAYFSGLKSEEGQVLYERYREAVKLARETDRFEARPEAQFGKSRFERAVGEVVWDLRDRRY